MTQTVRPQLRSGRWELVNSLSAARFTVRNLGLFRVTGQVPVVEAFVDIDHLGRPVGIQAELDLAGIDTGNPRRDHDLRTPRLLDGDRCPAMRFTATTSDVDEAQLAGQLVARGRAANLVLTIEQVRETGPGVVSVHATTQFDRRELGITAPRFLIGTCIKITLDAAFRSPAQHDRQ
jgi:polyisoprenoid-binding protein YceI